MEMKNIVNTNKADFMFYDEDIALAMKYNWESLCFSKNNNEFLSLLIDDKIFTLTTMGDTQIMDESGLIYKNENEDAIRFVFEDENLSSCAIMERNWFSLIVERIIDETVTEFVTVYEDNILFDAKPKSMDELKEHTLKKAFAYLES